MFDLYEERPSTGDLPLPILALLRTAGRLSVQTQCPLFVVGGFLRDLATGRHTYDLDLVVEGDGPTFATLLAAAVGGRVETVARFGTAHIEAEAAPGRPVPIDVATARREHYASPGALPTVEQADLAVDIARRDFTVNAIAAAVTPEGLGRIYDPFGGLADLRSGLLRVLHAQSFRDDPTRLLRGARFAGRLALNWEPETLRLAVTAVGQGALGTVSAERIRRELVLLLSEPTAGEALRSMAQVGLLQQLLPGVEMDFLRSSALEQAHNPTEELKGLAEPWQVKLALLAGAAGPAHTEAWVDRLKLARAHAEVVRVVSAGWSEMVALLRSSAVATSAVVNRLEGWPLAGLVALAAAGFTAQVTAYWLQWRLVSLNITGADLLAAGARPGPAIGRALDRVRAEVLDGTLPDRAAQLDRALRYLNQEA